MEQYHVTGMSCAACSSRVEKAVSKVPGVESLFGQSADQFHGGRRNGERRRQSSRRWRRPATGLPAKDAAQVQRVAAGNGASGGGTEADLLKDTETPVLKKRLIWSIVFLSCAYVFFHGAYDVGTGRCRQSLADNHVAMGLMQLLLTASSHGDQPEVFHQRFSEPVAQSAQYGYAGGTWLDGGFWIQHLCAVCHDRSTGARRYGWRDAATCTSFILRSAAMILTLITVGKMLEARSKGKTTDALKEPDEAGSEDSGRPCGTAWRQKYRWSRCGKAMCS